MAKTAKTHDVTGLGNALVDVTARVDDGFLAKHDLPKGGMVLVDAARADALATGLERVQESSGGSCANTLAGLATLGGRAAYIGLVRDDRLGGVFRDDLRRLGIAFDTSAADAGPGTGHCLTLVTPDGERTMCTHLGIAGALSPAHVDAAAIRAARIVYLEGYLFDRPEAQQAFARAAAMAADAGTEVALTLSDPFCVDRHRAAFRDLVAGHVDILFANRAELLSLYQVDDLDAAVAMARRDCPTVCATDSANGSRLSRHGETATAAPVPVERVMDATGAGDAYAAGVLRGLARGLPLAVCGRLGSMMGAAAVSRHGARPDAAALSDAMRILENAA